ncbi:MAG: hypothetical protein KIT76_11555 [Pseudolabrys sp.]|nr:hypothetical protein [Pseudolabrys sp.]
MTIATSGRGSQASHWVRMDNADLTESMNDFSSRCVGKRVFGRAGCAGHGGGEVAQRARRNGNAHRR